MNLQHQTIVELCQALKLECTADHYPMLAQQAVKDDLSFSADSTVIWPPIP